MGRRDLAGTAAGLASATLHGATDGAHALSGRAFTAWGLRSQSVHNP